MELEEIVEISGSCLYNILRSIAEKGRDEAIGDIIGRKYKKKYILINAFPWQKTESNRISVCHEDDNARKRVIQMDIEMRDSGIFNHYIIGQYHSHIFNSNEERVYLNLEDIDFFRTQMQWLKLSESIQIVCSIKIKKYARRQKPQEIIRQYLKKLRIIHRGNNIGYDIIFAAYKLERDKVRELPIRKRRIRVVARK